MSATNILVRPPLLPEVHVEVIFQLLLSSCIVREAAATLFALNRSFQEELIKIRPVSREPVINRSRNSQNGVRDLPNNPRRRELDPLGKELTRVL